MKSINFIETADNLNEVTMDDLRGGKDVIVNDCQIECSGSSCNVNKTTGQELSIC